MSEVSRVSVEGLTDLVNAMKDAHDALTTGLAHERSGVRHHDVDTQVFTKIDPIADWIETNLPELERRRNMAAALTGDRPTTTTVQFDEPIAFDSPEEAEQHGRDLAEEFRSHNPPTTEALANLRAGLEGYVDDPDVMAGFYLELGPQTTTLLPSLIESTGTNKGAEYLAMFSNGLGTALNTTDYTSSTSKYYTELAGLRAAFRAPAPEPGLAWDRLALLQHGDFPPRFVSDIVRDNVLDRFEGEDWDETDYRSGVIGRLGLSESTLALAFGALGNNPSAARIALREQGGISIEEYVDRVYGMAGSRGTGDAIAGAFGQALAAGSGASDDPPDKNSTTAEFAFETIQALGRHEDTPWTMREHVGDIAAAYAEELLAGANTLDGRGRESSMDRPANVQVPPGMDPAFFLSADDVYRFVYGMGSDDRFSADFDAAVQELYDTLPAQAIEADMAAMENRELDPRTYEAVLNMFGSLAGLQYQSQRQVRGDRDAADQRFRSEFAFGTGALLTMISGPSGTVAKYGYRLTKIAIGRGMDQWAGSAGTRVEELDELEVQARLLNDYLLADTMLQAGYPHSVDVPSSLLDDDGHLIPADQIVQNDDLLRQFFEWTDSNNEQLADNPDMAPFDDKFDGAWSAHNAGRDSTSEGIARDVGWGPSLDG